MQIPHSVFFVCSDGHCEVIPSIVSIEQSVVVVFETARKENQESARDQWRKGVNHVLHLEKAEKRTNPLDGDNVFSISACLLKEILKFVNDV